MYENASEKLQKCRGWLFCIGFVIVVSVLTFWQWRESPDAIEGRKLLADFNQRMSFFECLNSKENQKTKTQEEIRAREVLCQTMFAFYAADLGLVDLGKLDGRDSGWFLDSEQDALSSIHATDFYSMPYIVRSAMYLEHSDHPNGRIEVDRVGVYVSSTHEWLLLGEDVRYLDTESSDAEKQKVERRIWDSGNEWAKDSSPDDDWDFLL